MTLDLDVKFRSALADRYSIESELGRGAMAAVYLAKDLRHQRRVAIKVLRPDSGVPMSDVRFVREIKYLAQLNHPNILPLHDSGLVAGHLFYVMPHVRGETLRERLARDHRLAVGDALDIARQVGEALDYAHRHGVVHRDIKPENILLSDRVMVADFGIARAIGVAAGEALTTLRSVGPGTPAYMSPEQLVPGQELDGRSDLYSLGVVLYECLAGELPFLGEDGKLNNALKMSGPPPSIRAKRRDVPPAVDAAVARVLASVPRQRFTSALEFVNALHDAETVPRAPERKAIPWPWVAGVAAVAALIAVLVTMLLRG